MMIMKTLYCLTFIALVAGRIASSEVASEKENKGVQAPMRMVTRMCSELCASGLGGAPCGPVCENEGVHFKAQKASTEVSNGTAVGKQGAPRRNVCPLLCAYALGDPLCDCGAYHIDQRFLASAINWHNVCVMFCDLEGLTVNGCRKCGDITPVTKKRPQSPLLKGARSRPLAAALTDGDADNIDWPKVCHELCLHGDGGLACNCDLNP